MPSFHCRCCGALIEPDHWRVPEPLWCHRCPQHLLGPTDENGDKRELSVRIYSGQHGGDPCPFTTVEALAATRGLFTLA